ncbi:MAG TPA: hypothetical protein PK583_01415, partial [Gammaproteobacteria bacterium]|nr:hypothetical protein [Gammaproteobacteria bacterium]
QTFLVGRLIPHVPDEKKIVFIQDYIKAKLSGVVSSLTADLKNPLDFMTQENICFNMSGHLSQHSEQVTFVCAEKLKALGVSQDIKSIFDYPNIFYPYNNETGQHLIAINLESGQILNDGKQLLPLPKILFNNQQFVELFGDSVKEAFHCMLPGDREPSVYEIKKDGSDYWVKKNSDGYVFQKNIISKTHGQQRYQLIPYESLGDLNRFIPKTLIDNDHRFWLSINEPKELYIEEKGSNQAVCRITDFNTDAGYIESSPFKIWTQQQTAASFLGEKFSCFESTEFIEIRELQPALDHGAAVLNQPLYIIKFPRYQLTFHVIKTDPLVIHSINPEGTLLLSKSSHDLANLKNALFLQKKSGERIALLPRQYFIADKSIEEGAAEPFEYTPVRLDTQNKHQDLILMQKDSEKKYCKQSEFLECSLDTNGKIIAKTGADALYLAYVHLANFDPESALSILQACEKSGGIKGTQKEIENLILMFTSLPATSEQMEDVSEKMIDTPEFIAVKAYALYLYASAKYKETDREFVEPLNADGKCFYAEAKGAKDKLQGYLDTFLTKYQSIKNKIPADMQLTTQQELECLNLSQAPLLILQKNRLLAENLQKEQVTAFDPNQEKVAEVARRRLLEDKLSENYSEYQTQSCSFVVEGEGEDNTEISNLMDLSRTRENPNVSGKTHAECLKKYDSKEKIARATQQLSLNLELKEFFEYFLTYYHIATSKDVGLTEDKRKLKEFLAYKLKILGNGHPLYGKELIIILYKILESEQLGLKHVKEFLELVCDASYKVDGYTFDKDAFYKYLIDKFKNLTVTLEVEGIQKKVFSSEPKQFESLLAASNEPLTKARNYVPLKPLLYPSGIDILEKYHLQSMKAIAKSANSAIFLAEYKQLAFSGEAEVSRVKEELKNEKEQLRKKEEKVFVENKDDVSLLSFENFSSRELAYEKKIGYLKNQTAQKQVELATQHFSTKEQKEAVNKAVIYSLNSSKKCKEELLDLIKEMVNQGPASQESNRLHQLALQGKIRQEINEQTILNLYLLGDEKSFMDATGLAPAQVVKVYSLITEYLFVATHCQQLENIDKKLAELKDINDKDKPAAFANIANLLAAENSVEPTKDPAALSVFQFCGEALLRPEQAAYLRSHVEMSNHQFENLMSQLIMGFGKTFLLPIIAKAKATGNNLSVIEVPDPLFNTNVRDLNNASMRF